MKTCGINVVFNEFDGSAILILNSENRIDSESVSILKKMQKIHVNHKVNTVSLSTSVSDEEFVNIWNNYVESFISEFENFSHNGIDYILHYLYEQFKKYNEFFSFTRMDLNRYMGLYGELCFINEHYKKYGSAVIDNWGQPGKQRIDFNFNNEIYEIKSSGENTPFIKLSSKNQLNTVHGKKLFLVVYNLKVDRGKNICFNEIISSIKAQMETNDIDRQKFTNILKELSINDEDNYINLGKDFTLIDVEYYLIDSSFPQFHHTEGYVINDLGIYREFLKPFKVV